MRWATGARVRAEGLTLTTREGPVYTGVDLTARPGTLTVFQADSGGGRSALLLSLTGRMRPSAGSLYVDGFTLPKQARKVRRISSLGLMDDINALDERLRVHEHLTEALMLRNRPAGRGLVDRAVEAADVPGIDRSGSVKNLSTLERRRLGLALALIAEPRLLAVDEVDSGLGSGHQADLWRTLARLAEEGITVVATCADTRALDAVGGPLLQGPVPIHQEPGTGPDRPEESGKPDRTGATERSDRIERLRLRSLLRRGGLPGGDRADRTQA
ncbi:ATP-binding cassette domain-containing protein [Nocardiopsis kunsanensis]|uniref:ATP-binding cassette domain-containing protein n=1 Tax=Nocardiopsis kunsanensis TaxID=141693 RepID=UPI000345CDE7|nr:ATP-binding cassette domain-containing protein [Nocardiopsis kunsanensis]